MTDWNKPIDSVAPKGNNIFYNRIKDMDWGNDDDFMSERKYSYYGNKDSNKELDYWTS